MDTPGAEEHRLRCFSQESPQPGSTGYDKAGETMALHFSLSRNSKLRTRAQIAGVASSMLAQIQIQHILVLVVLSHPLGFLGL